MGDVPAYSDLGKNARNVFITGYHYGKGLVKLALKTKTEKALEVGSDFTMDFDATKSIGNMESKYKTKEYGSLTERWATDGTVTTEYSVEDKPSTGFGMNAAFKFRPVDYVKSMKFGIKYKNDRFNTGTTISNAFDSNVHVMSSLVAGFKEFLIGCEGDYDSASGITKTNVGLAFNIEDVGIHLACNDIPNEYGASLFYKVNSQWDAALTGIYATNGDNQIWTVDAGAIYKFNEDSTIRFKFNKDLQLGTSLQQKVREGVKFSVSMNLDFTNPTRGEHKVGLSLEMEA